MVNSCCAISCRLGYKDEDEPPDVMLHRFPEDASVKAAWVKAISRDDWEPAPHSRLCSLHFVASDYVKETRDTNQTRQKEKSGGLKRKILKKDAVPSQFPNIPKYFSHAMPQQRSTAALSTSRLAREMESLQVATKAFLSADKIQSLGWLKDQLQKETLPSSTNVKMESSGNCLNIFGLSHAENDGLMVSYNIQISSTLHYCLFLDGNSLPQAEISHILNNDTFTTVSQVINAVAFMNNKASQENTADEHIELGIQHLGVARSKGQETVLFVGAT